MRSTRVNDITVKKRISGSLTDFKISESAYWVWFWAILGFGLVLRVFWMLVFGIPLIAPDSWSYLSPALLASTMPISEIRTTTVPWIIALAIATIGHPMSIVLAHVLMWAISSVAIVLTLKKAFNIKVLGLVVLCFFAFTEKNLVFEFHLLSEHAARCFYLLFMAIVIIGISNLNFAVSLGMALVTLANIFVKPSAMPMTILALIFFVSLHLFQSVSVKRFAAHMLCYCGVVGIGLFSYMSAFEDRFGNFSLSNFDGYNLYAQVAHLTKLDGGIYPEIKSDMKTYLPTYVEKYANKGEYALNWVIYGSASDEMLAQIGPRSPIVSVNEYLGANSNMQRANKIFRELSIEGITENPLSYVKLTIKTFLNLIRQSFSTKFGDYFSLSSVKKVNLEMEPNFRNQVQYHYPNDVWMVERLRQSISDDPIGGPLQQWSHWESAVELVSSVMRFGANIANILLILAGAVFAFITVFTIGVFASSLWMKRKENGVYLWVSQYRYLLMGQYRRNIVAVALTGLMIFGYSLALSMFSVSDPARFIFNVQDLFIVLYVVTMASAFSIVFDTNRKDSVKGD